MLADNCPMVSNFSSGHGCRRNRAMRAIIVFRSSTLPRRYRCDGLGMMRQLPDVPNPDQADSNHDGSGDACQPHGSAEHHGGHPARPRLLLRASTPRTIPLSGTYHRSFGTQTVTLQTCYTSTAVSDSSHNVPGKDRFVNGLSHPIVLDLTATSPARCQQDYESAGHAHNLYTLREPIDLSTVTPTPTALLQEVETKTGT